MVKKTSKFKKYTRRLKKIAGKLLLIPLSLTMNPKLKATEVTNERPVVRKQKSYNSQEVIQVCEGVYAGEGITSKGEKIYFGLELLDDSNRGHWQKYAMAVDEMSADSRGYITALIPTLKNDRNHPNIEALGFNDEEYKNYADLLEKNGFLDKGTKGKQKKEALRLTRSGTAGLNFSSSKYMAYISKEPVVGKFDFSKTPQKRGVNLKQFIDCYGKILMSVGVRDGTEEGFEDSYTNRGIFRNPANMVEDTYKGISLLLHGFTAAAAPLVFGNKTFMSVNPTDSMHYLLIQNFNPGEMYIQYPAFLYTDGIRDLEKLEQVFINPKTKKAFAPIPEDLSILDDPEKEKIYLENFKQIAEKIPPREERITIAFDFQFKHLIRAEVLAKYFKKMNDQQSQQTTRGEPLP